MKKYKVSIQGMTCTSCEEHVTTALKNIGAKDIKTSYRERKTEFDLADTGIYFLILPQRAYNKVEEIKTV
ncbi:MAG: heavy metal-associated domain-containing protein [Atopococcus tabaci]|uniref:Heavy metal-associated domain-containing protein n=1 Tax=Atopococcus tabaci TaxID=269774 RepID=A0AA43ZSS3_9LACT|nr:heavy metal-associated domain-containing protein [Atopococcus tabaci]